MSVGSAEEWIQEAETDYKSALDLARRRKDPTPKPVCWHSHQCAEKYLKAFLVRSAKRFPLRHDLDELGTLCLDVDRDFQLVMRHLNELNAYGPEIRYPGTVASIQDARSAVMAIKQVRAFVRRKLGLK